MDFNLLISLLSFLFWEDIALLEVEIYFEGCCPDSQRFITGPFQTAWNTKSWNNRTHITLYPYGKCTQTYNEHTKEYDFVCQHGTKECTANTIMTCAIQEVYAFDPSQYVPFIIDYMTQLSTSSVCNGQNVVHIAETICDQHTSCDWSVIEPCLNGEQGNTAYHTMGVSTEKVNLNWVPWIVLNKIHNDEEQKTCAHDLVLCTESMLEQQATETTATTTKKATAHDSCVHYIIACGILVAVTAVMIGIAYLIVRNRRLKASREEAEVAEFQKMSDKESTSVDTDSIQSNPNYVHTATIDADVLATLDQQE
eukprot:285893_1